MKTDCSRSGQEGDFDLAGYCGSQTFEIVGLDKRLVEEYFSGALCRLSGIGLDEIASDALRFHETASAPTDPALEDAGFFRYRYGGEYHSFNPAVFRALHRAVRGRDPDEYARYASEVLGRPPATLRDLIEIRPGSPIGLDEVESADRLLARFSTSGMSLGALSKKAHEALAIAMNRLALRVPRRGARRGRTSADWRRSSEKQDQTGRIARLGVPRVSR